MSITAGSTARADDFINKAQANADPTVDAGRVPKLESYGMIDRQFLSNIIGGNGEDGDLVVSSGTTTLDLSLKTEWNYKSITISLGATLTFSNGSAGDKVPVLKCKGNFNNAGTITTVGLGVAGGTAGASCSGVNCTAGSGTNGTQAQVPFVDTTKPNNGLLGTGGTGQTASPSGGAGGTGGAAASKNAAYFAIYPLNGSGGGGGGGGANASVGTPGNGGAGGAGSLGLVLDIGGNFTNSGTINLNGQNGVAGVNGTGNGSNSWGSGGGGGGGGGGAGSLVCRYRGTYSNTGTITATGGIGGAGGSVTSLGGGGGSPRYGAGGGGGSGGATSFNSSLAGGNGSAPASSPAGGAGSNGGDGIIYIARVRTE